MTRFVLVCLWSEDEPPMPLWRALKRTRHAGVKRPEELGIEGEGYSIGTVVA